MALESVRLVWAAWRFHWRFERLLGSLAVLVLGSLAGCRQPPDERTPEIIARVGEHTITESVVQWIARRDDLGREAAKRKAIDTARLAQANSDAEHELTLDSARHEQILRGARARLWLKARFEPRHRPRDIPEDAPELVAARKDLRKVHRRPIYEVCSLIVVPLDPSTEVDASAWRQRAETFLAPVRRRIQQLVEPGDQRACGHIRRVLRHVRTEADGMRIKFEAAGYDLQACAERDEAGECLTPRWVPEWTDAVEKAEAPGFLPAFFTRFGLHLVYVHAIRPTRPPGDPATERALRQEVLEAWRGREFETLLKRLRQTHPVRIAPTVDPGEKAP